MFWDSTSWQVLVLEDRWDKYLTDFAISCKKTAQMSWAQHLSPCPLSSVGGFLGDFGLCFKLGCSGPSLLTCRRICSSSFMLSLQVSRSGHGQQQLAVSRGCGWLPLSPWEQQRKNLSGCGKSHKGTGKGFFSGAWITEHPPTKVICWINAHCRTGCIRRGRKRRKKSGLRSSLDIFGSSPGSVPLGRASSLYYKQKYATAPAGYQ